MDGNFRASASLTSNAISKTYPDNTSTVSRPRTSRSSGQPGTGRPKSGISALNNQEIVCAVTESRGISPIVGIALLNLHSAEAFLCQINDNQSYVRTIQKLSVYEPSKILVPAFATNAVSKLHACIDENLGHISPIEEIDRRYFAEITGHEYIQQFAFAEDIEAIKISIGGNYFAVCCFAAVRQIKISTFGFSKLKFSEQVMKYVGIKHGIQFPFHSLRVTYQPSEGSVMIDISTTYSLELIQNIENAKSKQCLFGLLNETQTPMGARYLRTNILQPSTDLDKINARLDAVEELSSKEDMFWATRQGLSGV
jgi:DNA mismatch repair protein MSH4